MSRITTDLERERVLQRSRHELLVKLEQAIEHGDVPYLRILLSNYGLTGEVVGFFLGSQTILHRACIAGQRECVVELLKAGANPRRRSP